MRSYHFAVHLYLNVKGSEASPQVAALIRDIPECPILNVVDECSPLRCRRAVSSPRRQAPHWHVPLPKDTPVIPISLTLARIWEGPVS